jgi:uncharacterized peroxidase-related enzyme
MMAGEQRLKHAGEVGPATGFLRPPEVTGDVQRLYDGDVAGGGYVMNLSVLWAQLPQSMERLSQLLGLAAEAASLTFRQRGILVTACASTRGDSYCALAWGKKLADAAGVDVAQAVLGGDDAALDPIERALARWARDVASDPNGTRAADVQALRDAGFDDRQIFAVTLFVALRMAFSTVNDALGALPDHEFRASVPAAVRESVTYGRPVAPGQD